LEVKGHGKTYELLLLGRGALVCGIFDGLFKLATKLVDGAQQLTLARVIEEGPQFLYFHCSQTKQNVRRKKEPAPVATATSVRTIKLFWMGVPVRRMRVVEGILLID
jgi:hypothetical protein